MNKKPLPFITLRTDYLAICNNDACAATILSTFEFWTRGKIKSKSPTVWIYKKQTELQADLGNIYGLNKIGSALKLLREKGFLTVRSNPTNGQIKTLEYRFESNAVHTALGECNVDESKTDDLSPSTEPLELKSECLETTHSYSDKTPESKTELLSEITAAAPTRSTAAAATPIGNLEESFDGEQTGEHAPAKPLERRESDHLKDSELLTDAHPHPPISAVPPAPTLEKFYGGAAAFARLERQYGRERLEAERRWCESEKSHADNPAGLAIFRLRQGAWTPAVGATETGQPGEQYLGGIYASFLANYQES